MIKILVLQHWYSLSDQKMERELANNLSFMNFLGYPETIPDSTTIWLFRERLKEKKSIDAIWQEVQRQLDAKGLIVKEGSIQDATLLHQILADLATSLVAKLHKLVEARMEPGQRKAINRISATSYMKM